MSGQIQLIPFQNIDPEGPFLVQEPIGGGRGSMLKANSKGLKDTCITQAAVKALRNSP